jgi:hypothetical protein
MQTSLAHAARLRDAARRARLAALMLICASGVVLCGCSRGGAPSAQSPRTVPRALCGPGDHPETALQGQVPAPLRRPGGFAGFNCNLQLVAQSRGDGAGWQAAFSTDAAGHSCGYYDTAPTRLHRTHTGVVVMDVTDLAHPTPTDYLSSDAMYDPLESLKVSAQRHLLGAVGSVNASGGPDIELYDLAADCRAPRLLSRPPPNRLAPEDLVRADEGSFSPDGLTYYATNLHAGSIDVIDVADPAKARRLAEWDMPFNQQTSGIALSADGNRAYLTLFGHGQAAPTGLATSLDNGIVIADVSDVQSRRPHPQIRVISTLLWGDGSGSHQVMPVRIGGRSYLIASDQGGSGLTNAAGWMAACSAGLPAFGMVRIIDISDEKSPRIISRLQLEVNDPSNCRQVIPDLTGLSGFTYDSHYCSTDDPQNATALACAFFESGIRVFDIRDALHPREIAYFVPPSATVPSPGSQNTRGTPNGRPDHCSAQMRLDATTAGLMTTCQDNGFLTLKFTHGVWPFTRLTNHTD